MIERIFERRSFGPHISDGISLILLSLYGMGMVINSISYWTQSPWRITVFIVLPIFGIFGAVISWNYLRDQQSGKTEQAEVVFAASKCAPTGVWKTYQSIKADGTTVYLPLDLFNRMERDKVYKLSYLIRTRIVQRINEV